MEFLGPLLLLFYFILCYFSFRFFKTKKKTIIPSLVMAKVTHTYSCIPNEM